MLFRSRCADQLLKEGKSDLAFAIYEELDEPGNPRPVRLAALRGTLERLQHLDAQAAQFYAKEALKRLADAAQVALLLELAEQSGQERYARMAGYYAAHFLDHQDYPAEALADREVWGGG